MEAPLAMEWPSFGIADMMRYSPLLALVMLLSACMPGVPSGDMDIHKVDFSHLSYWEQEQHQPLLSMVRTECRRLTQLAPNASLGGATSLPYGRKVSDWAGACRALPSSEQTTPEEARQYFETWFQPYLIQEPAFYTGYYEPQVEASLQRQGVYQYPLYRRPADLLRGRTDTGAVVFGHWVNSVFQPYDDRAAINAGALNGKGLEIAWLKSPVDVFFLQLQGAGRLHLPDGKMIRVAYDGRNGQPYNPIGRVLVERGALKTGEVTAESIREWLQTHPQDMLSVMEKNPNYVFFRKVERSPFEGPGGALGIPLTPQRSLAIDRALVPYATPIWVETSVKDQQGQMTPWKHLTFAQDVGTNIRGAGRADLFTGWGESAEAMAGDLKSPGRMILLLPRPSARSEDASEALDFPPK
ncbi:murein transglycosylase [Saccharibacter sp. EH611]|nr:murein transglycosylase [Saccharibacter sp. EH611]MXV57065.1 murein transglycosylase [Saccharibacter sp. EH70]MXV66575.1 murein transglycosylase [Saccharibacter sp. EH60]